MALHRTTQEAALSNMLSSVSFFYGAPKGKGPHNKCQQRGNGSGPAGAPLHTADQQNAAEAAAQTSRIRSRRTSGAPEGAGAAQPHSSGNNNKHSCRRNTQAQSERSNKQIDLCEVLVSNLSNKVTERMLHTELSRHAQVEKVTIKYKKMKKDKICAIVKVGSTQDVQKLLALRKGNRNIQGQIFTIKGAKNSVKLPGDSGCMHRSVSGRDFDQAIPDPEQPSIHMLVDDIMLKVFSYLPMKFLLTCDGVCRRWQMLLHKYFSMKTTLVIQYPLTETDIPKLLKLSGPNLRSLKIDRINLVEKQNILKVIGQLCPQLEYLDVSESQGIDFTHIEELAKGCENIKGFVARHCLDFSKSGLRRLLSLCPKLEKLDVQQTEVRCKDYKALPGTLKELHIDSYRPDGKKQTISMIADKCPNLEALTLRDWEKKAASLMYIGNTCHKLTKLSVHFDGARTDNFTEALLAFKQLKELEVSSGTLDLRLIFKSLSQLEVLILWGVNGGRDTDFSILEKLKSLTHCYTQLTEESLKTVAKCRELEKVLIDSISEERAMDILQSCPKLKKMTFPRLKLSRSLLHDVKKIMNRRPGTLEIGLNDKTSIADFLQYDRKKIRFIETMWMDDSDSDSEESSSWSDVDSDDSFFEPWVVWPASPSPERW